MPRKGDGRRQALLEDQDVARWYKGNARRSRATADNYLRMLGLFCERARTTPQALVQMDPTARDDLLDDHIDWLLDERYSRAYAFVIKKALRSWLKHHGLDFTREIKVGDPAKDPERKERPKGTPPRRSELRVPEREELRKVLRVADARARTAIGLMAFAGLRPQVLGTYRGNDGLRLRDLPELVVDGESLLLEKVPTRVEVPARLSKIGRPFFTFNGREGSDYLVGYLQERIHGTEDLGPDSPVITPKFARKPFMRALNIGDLVRKPMRATGLEQPPYIWRSYFSSRCTMAEGRGLTRDWREFFMGHKGGVAEAYSTNKQLPPDTVDVMRSAYEAASAYLETRPSTTAEDRTSALLRAFLKAAGYAEEEIEAWDLAALDEDAIADLIRQAGSRRTETNGGRPRQRLIPTEDLPAALEAGWVYRDSLVDGRIIVERAA